MTDKKVSDETSATALDGSELTRIVQGGSSVKSTVAAVALSVSDTDVSLAANSDVIYPTQRAVKAYVAAHGGSNAAAFNGATAFTAFGDSYTVGDGASDAAHKYINLLAAARGWTLTNTAVSAQQASDCASQVFIFGVVNGSQTTLQIGTNDARAYAGAVPLQGVFKRAHLALACWLAIPDSHKQYGQAYDSKTGTWLANTGVYGTSMVMYATANASTITYSRYGTVIYVCMAYQTNNTSTYSIAVDGVTVGTYSCAVSTGSIATVLGGGFSPNLIRIPGLSEGMHTVVITAVAVGGSSPYVNVLWVAGNLGHASKDGPNVWVGNVPRLDATGYASLGGSDAIFAVYNDLIRRNVDTLASDGLNVALVDSASRTVPATDLYTDHIHPDDAGHQKIADAFIEAINQIGKPRLGASKPIGPMRINPQTGTAYTVAVADCGSDLQSSNASAQTIILPPDNAAAIDIGDTGVITMMGAGVPTLSTNSGASTIRSGAGLLAINGQYTSAYWQKIGANEFLVRGSLA